MKLAANTSSIFCSVILFYCLIPISETCSVPSCQTCNSTNIYDCNTCVTPFVLIGTAGTINQTCCASTISNCRSCATNSSRCSACIDNTFCIDSGTGNCALCSSRITNCTRCSNCNTCLNCSSNLFGLNSSSMCQPCSTMENCAECSNATNCTLCSNTSFALNSTARCQSCSTFMPNCVTCSSRTVCTTCVNNSYGLNSSNLCQLCSVSMPNCTTCTSATNCSTCENTSFALNTTFRCQLCSALITNCNICSNRTNCTSCVSNLYALNSTSKCQACTELMSNCYRCSNTFTCIGCVNNTFVVNSTNLCQSCSSLMSNCMQCSNKTNCTACINNTFTINSSSLCQSCSSLMGNCSQCSSVSVCTICVNDSFTINATTSRCQPCVDFLNDCTNCNNPNICNTCQPNPNIALSNGKCTVCNRIMPFCLNCTSFNFCTLCNTYYGLKLVAGTNYCYSCFTLMFGCLDCLSSSSCLTCSIGVVVKKGCSAVAGCTSVIQTPPTAICEFCNYPQFQFLPVNGTCLCRKGHLAGKFCTQVTGCINIVRINGTDRCSACSTPTYFTLKNDSLCYCQEHFYRSGDLCYEICGDGFLFNLPCDDGNLIDGDGCSSTCKVERRYRCTGGGSNRTKSKCVYQGRIQLDMQCINNLGGNTGSITLYVSPWISNFQKSNLSNRIYFNSADNCTMTGYLIQKPYLFIFFKYQNDVQNAYTNLSIWHDTNFILSPQSVFYFRLSDCQGHKLIYQQGYNEDFKTQMNFIMKLISFFSWAAFLIGSYSHKMIGVETLHTIQFIFFMQIYSYNYYPAVAYFQRLNNILNAFSNDFLTTFNRPTNQYYSRLGYSAGFSQNIFIITLAEAFSVLLLGLLKGYQIIKKNDKTISKQNNPKPTFSFDLKTVPRYRELIYNFLVFPIIIGSFIHFFITLVIHTYLTIQNQNNKSQIQSLMCVFMMICTSIIYFSQWKSVIYKCVVPPPNGVKVWYIPIYLTNLVCITFIGEMIFLGIISNNQIFVFASLEFLNACVLLIYRPYYHPIHFIGIIINQLGILGNFAWILSSKFTEPHKDVDKIIAYSMMAYICLIICWSFVRSIFQIKNKRQFEAQITKVNKILEKNKNKTSESKNDQIVKEILKENEAYFNQYSLNFQLLKRNNMQYQKIEHLMRMDEKTIQREKRKSLRRLYRYTDKRKRGEE